MRDVIPAQESNLKGPVADDHQPLRESGLNITKKLSEFIGKEQLTKEQFNIEVTGLAVSSEDVLPGYLFFGYPGAATDGRRFIGQAVSAGASVVMVESGLPHQWIPQDCPVAIIEVVNLKSKVGQFASRFFEEPSQEIQLIGITGTNGKTTCAHLVSQALTALDVECAQIGTLGMRRPGEVAVDSKNTTPDPISIQSRLAAWLGRGASSTSPVLPPLKAVAMEVTSHALDQGRVEGCQFYTTLFTNLSRDHLDDHGTIENYASIKKRLFTDYPIANAVINIDDPVGAELFSELLASRPAVGLFTFSLKQKVPIQTSASREVKHCSVEKMVQHAQGTSLVVRTPDGLLELNNLPVWGRYNVSNILATIAVLLSFKFSNTAIAEALSVCDLPAGRMQYVKSKVGVSAPNVFVDYAHTPDAVEKALLALREHCVEGASITALVGCGGDRDIGKRALMGRTAASFADKLMITSDNPRFESPKSIIEHTLDGIDAAADIQLSVEPVRRAAIWEVVCGADDEDLVIVLGRGHESIQKIGALNIPLPDECLVGQAIEQRSKRMAWDRKRYGDIAQNDLLLSLDEIARMVGGRIEGADVLVRSVGVVDRSFEQGALVVDIDTDGTGREAALGRTFEKGASAVMVDEQTYQRFQGSSLSGSLLIVNHVEKALHKIGRVWRRTLGVPTVAWVGDQSPSGLMDIYASLLEAQGNTLTTTLDRESGLQVETAVSMALLSMRVDHQYALISIEAETNEQIDHLLELVEPDIVLVHSPAAYLPIGALGTVEPVVVGVRSSAGLQTSLLSSHQFTEQTIAIGAKLGLTWAGLSTAIEGVGAQGDDRAVTDYTLLASGGDAELLRLAAKTPKGLLNFQLPYLGWYYRSEIVAMIAAAELMGIAHDKIVSGIAQFKPAQCEPEVVELAHGFVIIDDTDRRDIFSARKAIDLLAECDGSRLIILCEPGNDTSVSTERYLELGRYALTVGGIDTILVVGDTPLNAMRAIEGSGVKTIHISTDPGGIQGGVVSQGDKGRAVMVKVYNDYAQLVNELKGWREHYAAALISGSCLSLVEEMKRVCSDVTVPSVFQLKEGV